MSTITLTGGLLVLSMLLASLWGLEVTLAGPGLGAFTAGTEESTRDGRMGEGLRMEGRPPYTLQPARTQSQSQIPWMCVCLWIADASKRPTLEFPLKLLGHSTESRVEKQMRSGQVLGVRSLVLEPPTVRAGVDYKIWRPWSLGH